MISSTAAPVDSSSASATPVSFKMTDSFQRRLSTASRQPKCATFCGLARLAAVFAVSLKPLHAGSAQPPTGEPLAAAVPPAFASVPGLPLCFEVNAGQGGDPVRFVARNRDGVFCVRPTETVITLRKAGSPTVPGFCPRTRQEPGLEARTVSIQFLGANASARMTGTGELRGKVNYLIGNDPAKWQRSVKTFARVEVQEAYPGIKVIHYGNQRQLEYDFMVAPGADPHMIAFRVTGADQLEIDPQGDLLIKLGADHIRQKKPIIYQVDHGLREEIPGGYRLSDNQVVAFQVGSYDRELPLVIDPVLSYSTFLGGLDNDTGRAIVLDNSGNVYLAGDTLSSQLGTTDAFQ